MTRKTIHMNLYVHRGEEIQTYDQKKSTSSQILMNFSSNKFLFKHRRRLLGRRTRSELEMLLVMVNCVLRRIPIRPAILGMLLLLLLLLRLLLVVMLMIFRRILNAAVDVFVTVIDRHITML